MSQSVSSSLSDNGAQPMSASFATPSGSGPFGSASVLLLSWVYIHAMGGEGLTNATRLALLSALTSHVAQELLAGIEVLGARVAALPEMADDELARACADEVVTALLALARRQDLVRAQSELVLEAARTPELLDILTPWRRALIDIVASIGSTVDPVKATDRAETTVAAFQGVLATSLWHPTQARAAYVERSSRQLLDLLQA